MEQHALCYQMSDFVHFTMGSNKIVFDVSQISCLKPSCLTSTSILKNCAVVTELLPG
jgi:hypothetical protein